MYEPLRSITYGLFAMMVALTSATAGHTKGTADPSGQSVYVVVLTWINDHSAILPYRKDTLPFVLKQGATWAHLMFPESIDGSGFNLKTLPDEFHVMRFDSFDHMQAIFSAPEYTEPAEKYFNLAFSRTLNFPAVSDNFNVANLDYYENYFAVAFIDLKDGVSEENLISALNAQNRNSGLRNISSLSPAVPPGNDTPDTILIASFTDRHSYEAFMASDNNQKILGKNTNRHTFIAGFDTKRPLK